jgi:cytochrome c biogenesis protein CcmG, thiol:disulfide interchange protein DsbE
MNNKVLLYVIGGVLGLGLVIAIAVSAVSGGGNADEEAAFGEVTVEGEELPVFGGDPAADVAPGLTAPTVTGEGLDGSTVSIAPDGNPKVVLFLAHWCPHCQDEVPDVVDWMEAGNMPEGVDFYAISTLAQRLRGNWPPSDWLASEGWSVPTIQDDRSNSASAAFGMQGTPFWVVLNGDNTVIARIPGQVGHAGMDAIFATAAAEA